MLSVMGVILLFEGKCCLLSTYTWYSYSLFFSPFSLSQRYHCETCDDYDLCSICKCRVNHDPAHNFRLEDKHVSQFGYIARDQDQEAMESAASAESNPPPQAVFVCDYCDSDIVGIRHTCGACPGTSCC